MNDSDLCQCGHSWENHGEILGCTALRTPVPTPNTASTYDCPCLEFEYATEDNSDRYPLSRGD